MGSGSRSILVLKNWLVIYFFKNFLNVHCTYSPVIFSHSFVLETKQKYSEKFPLVPDLLSWCWWSFLFLCPHWPLNNEQVYFTNKMVTIFLRKKHFLRVSEEQYSTNRLDPWGHTADPGEEGINAWDWILS